MAHLLVTGGCGFIGGRLAHALVAEGHRVRVLDDLSTGRREAAPAAAELIVGDVADPAAVRNAMEDVDGCYHLAAIASVQRGVDAPQATTAVNLGGTAAVLDAARAAATPVVYASSAAVYGAQETMPIREDAPCRPTSAYGVDKLASELHARVAGQVHHIPTFGLRFFNVYGPGQPADSPYSGVIARFMERLTAGAAIELHGDGHQTRDFVFVDDVVRHLIAAMAQASVEAPVVNVCTGSAISIRQLAILLRDLIGARPEIRLGPARPGDIRASIGSPERARERLRLAADTPIEKGLAYLLAETSGLAAAA